MPFPYIFTFYSYKGGVGRSMALMNVAYRLAGWGRHVLIVDMDLEAPGLSRSNEFSPPGKDSRDVVDLLADGLKILNEGSATKEKARQFPALSTYIRPVIPEKLAPLTPKMGQLGRLDLLGADVDRTHLERLAKLGLKDCSHENIGELSKLLHYFFKSHRFDCKPFWLEDFEPSQKVPYDFILVDSRTGITEIGGLCVGPLSDRLVVLTGLNDQNIQGTLDVLQEVGIDPRQRSVEDTPWDSEDDLTIPRPSLGPKPTIVVASPVPLQEIALRDKRFAILKDRLGIGPLQLSYHPLLALEEVNFVRDHPDQPLSREYEGLTEALMALVGDDSTSLLGTIGGYFTEDKTVDLSSALGVAARLASCDSDLGIASLGPLADAHAQSRVPLIPNIREAHALLSQYGDAKPFAFNNWGLDLTYLAQGCTEDLADPYSYAAYRRYAEALELKPDHYRCLYNWGAALLRHGHKKSGEQANRLFEQSAEKFAKAFQLKQDYTEALAAWGTALLNRGMRTEAIRKSFQAEQLRPGSASLNLAYVAAMDGDKEKLLEYLTKIDPKPERQRLTEPRVFAPYRDDPDFLAFLNTLPEN